MKKKKTKKKTRKTGNLLNNIQQNPDASNTDGWFTLDDSTSFLSPCQILTIVQENKI